METKKTLECDVTIVGGGNAALCAALEATNLGIRVLLLEKADVGILAPFITISGLQLAAQYLRQTRLDLDKALRVLAPFL